MEKRSDRQYSEDSFDVHISSYPVSTRSSRQTVERFDDPDPNLKEAINFLDQDKEFLIAAEIGDDKLLLIYIRRGVNINQLDHIGRTALHLAVCSDNFPAIKLLLEAGVKTNIKDNLGMTALSLCLMRNPSLAVAKLLFEYGAKILPRSCSMDTGLFIQFVMMCLPTLEEEAVLRLLVTKGAVVNDADAPGGRQALHFAAMSNNTTLIKILMSLGGDLTLVNHRNETPLEVASTFNCIEAYNLLRNLEDTTQKTSSRISNIV